MTELTQDTAQQLLDVVPLVMRTIRSKLRELRSAEISVPQFRALVYINRHDGASLSDLTVHIGLTLPSMSKLIDGLVNRKLVNRIAHSTDRRRVCLSLTAQGQDELNTAYKHTQRFLASKLSALAEEDLATISQAMKALKDLFLLEHEDELTPQPER